MRHTLEMVAELTQKVQTNAQGAIDKLLPLEKQTRQVRERQSSVSTITLLTEPRPLISRLRPESSSPSSQ